MKDIIVIGAGPGGLSTAMLLAHRGYNVRVFEKQGYIGGRNSQIKLGDYSFDMGPTFFLMKEILEEIFTETGRNLEDYVDLIEINPMYRLKFGEGKTFYPWSASEKERMIEEIERVFPGESGGYLEYLRREEEKFQRLIPCLQIPYSNLADLFKLNFIKALPYLDAHKSLYTSLGRYFKEDLLRLSFTFQAKYIGMSPWEAPGTFSIISYLEHKMGIYHVKGGLNRLSHAMAEAVVEDGGSIEVDCPVREILFEGRKAVGVELADGRRIEGDHVIMNADFAMGMKKLIPDALKDKYSDTNLQKKKYSCSTFMLYLGLDKVYEDLPHHNIIFAKNYRENIADITERKIISEDFSFYVQNASVSDPTLAPEGRSALYVLVPVPNNKSSIDWEREKHSYRDMVMRALENEGGFEGISESIEEERIITPADWEKEMDVYLGATFNLGHQVSQMLILRPHNKLEGYENLYIVGGGTHPGSGLPTIYESGRITANLIHREV
ncbi:phytoene desaturase [Propionigenium maris DSM 9537]|uniref:Phytoene desaturase n=1 Tax=Propionigenium maris DSM 9537 TaxID=1123000 RepID=A0A9W6LM28_9FUSO|nr:phytoene desaturase family protein [Propionigenium maris]GLI55008.1 phytoene desaturase [Propionigenium maris DSM 9537]